MACGSAFMSNFFSEERKMSQARELRRMQGVNF